MSVDLVWPPSVSSVSRALAGAESDGWVVSGDALHPPGPDPASGGPGCLAGDTVQGAAPGE